MRSPVDAHLAARTIAIGLVVAVALVIVQPFLPALMWALLIAYWTWPIHERLRRRMRPLAAALLLTLGAVALIALPILWLLETLRQGLGGLGDMLPAAADTLLPRLREWAALLPFVGHDLAALIPGSAAELDAEALIKSSRELVGGFAATALARAGSGLFQLTIAVLTLFFLYRDGPRWLAYGQARIVASFGTAGARAWATTRHTLSAVTRGVILAAGLQALVAGLGYWVAGLPNAVLLTVLTAAVALVPLGAALVWLPASIWLMLTGETLVAVGLAVWGVAVVSTVDNLFRPLAMRSRSTLSFWPLTLSLIGGALAFGLPGVYLGPVVFSLLALWWDARPAADPAAASDLEAKREATLPWA
jgi:predicted PurR-regulated permease PerM